MAVVSATWSVLLTAHTPNL